MDQPFTEKTARLSGAAACYAVGGGWVWLQGAIDGQGDRGGLGG